ncbi:MAG TPA: type I 3-dehydroquinate dehydratase [Candidatus Nitrosotalea sp.]|nr:type I 3-dehydroquinate dehydratase [Candidatus Nitrosotalea sp.]
MASKTCVSIGVFSVAKLVAEAKRALRRSDYAELRLDFLDKTQIPDCLNRVKPYLGRCICTLRPRPEGGKFSGTEAERISILKLIAEYNPFLMDVEYNTLRKNKRLYQYLKKTRTGILVSWHDFGKTPTQQTLRSMKKKMAKFSKNIKIVTTAKSIKDTLRVLNLYRNGRKENLIAFAMGDYGRMSRILCTKLGSPFTYVSLGRPIAPGQFSLEEMRAIFQLQN